jgi:flavorubredoxin
LILDDKIVLVDTVWGPFQDQLIENLREIIDPAKIDMVVANHSETDHSGGLPAVMRHIPNATVVVSTRGEESVEGHYHQPWKFRKVKTGEKIAIGKNELIFVEAPMLHWPEACSPIAGKKILAPNDALGSMRHRFPLQRPVGRNYASDRYANILAPFTWS